MVVLFINLVGIVIVGILFIRVGRDRRVDSFRPARWLRVVALILLAVQVAVLLFFGIGEMASGDLSGIAHLFPLVSIVLLALLAWFRPLEGGVALLFTGLISLIAYRDATARMFNAAPLLISGTLFLIAGMLARRASTPSTDNSSQA